MKSKKKRPYLGFLKEYAFKKKLLPYYILTIAIIVLTAGVSLVRPELQGKVIDMIVVETIWEAENKLLECQDIELILCDLFLQDGIAMDFFHSMKKLAGIYQNTKEPIFRELPFFIFTDNKDLSLEYRYRHEGVSDYITSPVNIPDLIRRICYFVEA